MDYQAIRANFGTQADSSAIMPPALKCAILPATRISDILPAAILILPLSGNELHRF